MCSFKCIVDAMASCAVLAASSIEASRYLFESTKSSIFCDSCVTTLCNESLMLLDSSYLNIFAQV